MGISTQVSNTSTVLIVDDNQNNLRLLSAVLTHEGYAVREAINGAIALKAIRELPPDLILLDVMMPEMDGYEVCRLLKQDQVSASVPVIFISALTEVFDKVQAFNVGGADYITKPFHFEEVIVRVRHHLALREAEQKLRRVNEELEARVRERTEQLEQANARLVKMALYDKLTGLPNRVFFTERLEETLRQLAQHTPNPEQPGFAVFFLDCDRFKIINDSLGHAVGDQLLTAVAQRLQSQLQSTDVLARFGGDEFAILLPYAITPERATNLAQQIAAALSKTFRLPSCDVFVSASIGIVLGGKGSRYERPEHVLRDVDTAMYRAKASGEGQFLLFEPAMHHSAMHRLQLETSLRKALDNRELVPYYQPILHLESQTLSGFEALARWRHPESGLIPPDMFIPIAEETGLIRTLDLQILAIACRQLCYWQQQGIVGKQTTISVNLSAKQLMQPELVTHIDQILADAAIAPQNLVLEITESALMLNPTAAVEQLKKLRDRAIRISIDDFGTGYSSLSYLHKLPLDALKIDKSFVQAIQAETADNRLIPLILNIAKTMEISVTAEGIETPEQARHLSQLNCLLGQGYWFARPMPAPGIEEFLSVNLQLKQ
ncbi:MAG: EAL domain-containing protein [Cyanobacteria bacterium P01_C01_bin.73]